MVPSRTPSFRLNGPSRLFRFREPESAAESRKPSPIASGETKFGGALLQTAATPARTGGHSSSAEGLAAPPLQLRETETSGYRPRLRSTRASNGRETGAEARPGPRLISGSRRRENGSADIRGAAFIFKSRPANDARPVSLHHYGVESSLTRRLGA